MAQYSIRTDQIIEYSQILKAGDSVKLSGVAYTSRDAAHKRIFELLENGGDLPVEIKGASIYYAGPTPTPENKTIGSCGPTTSGRMDKFAPKLLDLGLASMIGKGPRSKEVCEAISRNKAVYFCAVGGAGALYSKCIESCEEIDFFDLGCESVKKLVLNDFPVIVGIDCHGGNLF